MTKVPNCMDIIDSTIVLYSNLVHAPIPPASFFQIEKDIFHNCTIKKNL